MPQARYLLPAALVIATNLGAFLIGRATVARKTPAKNFIEVRLRDDATGDNGGHWDWSDDDTDTCSCDSGDATNQHKQRPAKAALDMAAPNAWPRSAPLLFEVEALRSRVNTLERMVAAPRVEVVGLADAGSADEPRKFEYPSARFAATMPSLPKHSARISRWPAMPILRTSITTSTIPTLTKKKK